MSLPEKCQCDGKDVACAGPARSCAGSVNQREVEVLVAALITVSRGELLRFVPGVLFSVALAAGAARCLADEPVVQEIDWRSSPLDLNLRGLNGERFRFRCPAGKVAPGQVTGAVPYTDGSAICAAAVHAGALRASAGGVVTIEIRPGQASYAGSLSHFIQSASYDALWGGSFLVITDAPAVPPERGASRQVRTFEGVRHRIF